MTMAVCFKCGKIKFGAFVPCPVCASFPQTEDELALSMAMTDHYFDMPTLEQMGAAVRDGDPPHLDPETRAGIIAQTRRTGILNELQKMHGGERLPQNSPEAEPAPQKKPWWQFWK